MYHQASRKRSLSDLNCVANSSKECNNTPYKRRKQTSQALETLGQLIKHSSPDDFDADKFNKNDILSMTLSRLLRRKYWPSHLPNTNVQLAADIKSRSIEDDLAGFIVVLNTSGRIILFSDNVEYYLRKNVRLLHPQLTSIYDCISKDDHGCIRAILSTPTMNERCAICTWILPRGRRPNRSNTETKSMLLTGHFFFAENDPIKEPLFVARCEHILSSIPNIPSTGVGSTSATTLRFVLTDRLNICEISSNTESLLGYRAHQLIDQSIHHILPTECFDMLEQDKQNCLLDEHCTSMNVIDMYTSNGDRLTFLCNTHILTAGRHRTMKLGFLAQLIDSSIRYDCHRYANQQNIARQKTSVEQKSILLSNMILNNSTKTNMSMSPNESCVTVNSIERQKHQRVIYQYAGNENLICFDKSQLIPQLSLKSNIFSSSKQELGYIDEFFTWFDEEKSKPNSYSLPIDDIQDAFSMHHFPDFHLSTPTIPELHFFS